MLRSNGKSGVNFHFGIVAGAILAGFDFNFIALLIMDNVAKQHYKNLKI